MNLAHIHVRCLSNISEVVKNLILDENISRFIFRSSVESESVRVCHSRQIYRSYMTSEIAVQCVLSWSLSNMV